MKKLLLFGALLFWLNGLIAQTNFIHQDSVFTRTSNCDAGVAVCIDSFTYDSINSLRFYLNGRQFSTVFTSCSIDTIHNYGYTDIFRGLERGPWRLDSWIVSGRTFTGNFASLQVLVDSMRRWDPLGDWRLEPISKTIFGFAKNGRQYSCQNITGLGRGGRSEICYNIGVEFKGLRFSVPSGVREFVVEKVSSGLRDTVQLVSACISPDTVRKTIALGSSQNYCFDVSQLLGRAGALVNFCNAPTTHTVFDAPLNGCIRYAGATVGKDTACLRVCDQYGNCDTTILIVTAESPLNRNTIIEDTITVGLTRTHSGIVIPIGTINSFTNVCPANSGNNITFTLDTVARTITFTGITEGVDTACIRVCNTLNICDTTTYRITAKPVVNPTRITTHFFRDTITVGLAARPKCTFDAPVGAVTIFQNFCGSSSGTNVAFTIDTATKCIKYQGVTVGTDTACMRVCNAAGQCDTTFVYVEALQRVTPAFGRRIVIEDTITSGLTRTMCSGSALSFPTGTITIFRNICPSLEPVPTVLTNVDIDSLTKCIRFTGGTRGKDSICLLVCNSAGICDTTILKIRVIGGTYPPLNLIVSGPVGEKDKICQLDLPISGRPKTIRQTCGANLANPVVTTVLDTVNFCLKYEILRINTPDSPHVVCIEVCDSVGVCATTTINFFGYRQGITKIIRDTVIVGQTDENCALQLPSNPIFYQNFCTSTSGRSASFTIDTARRCVSYRGLTPGIDTACILVCGSTVFQPCDTTRFIITVIQAPNRRIHEFRDTITAGLTRDKCNFDAPTNPTRIRNICEAQSGSNVDFMLDTTRRCVNYMGITPGVDTACIEVCNAAGLCDTTYMYITTQPRQILRGRFLTDSIIVRVGETKNFCTDSSRVGAAFIRQFYNTNPIFATVIPTSNACVSIRGGVVGRDTINMILIGNGINDTTRIFIIVLPATVLPTKSVDTISLKIFETKAYCPDSSELRGSPIRFIGFCSTDPFNNTSVRLDTVRKCLNVRGISTGQDTFCLVLCNVAGFCDTTTLFVNVSRDTVLPTIKLDSVNVFVGDSLTYCGIDTSEIRGVVDSISNYCSQSSGVNSNVQITTSKCLKIKGLRVGVDTACIVVCNRVSRLCDTTRVRIIVSIKPVTPPKPSIDSISVAVGQSKNYCPDSTELRGSPVTSIKFCTPLNADNATITLDSVTKCAKIVGNTVGRDTACIVLCNAAGVCDTTTLYVRVTPRDTSKPVSNTVLITVDLTKDTLFCGVDTLQIRGLVDTIFDACNGKNGLRALMVLDRVTKCVKITGRAVGKDTMCLVVRNNASGLSDTTFIIVTVRDPRGIRVIANDDFDTLRRGGVKDFFVYLNDTLSRAATSLKIVQAPKRGRADTVSFNRGILQYFAGRSPAACGLDSFRYRVCIDTVCAEATVVVLVICSDSLIVYNGISPNGDAKNQTWLIEGLQNYPNHTVCVFNRWGNEVLKTKDYQNDWEGKWDGKDLPDGTYFYWIRNDDNGEILKTGYLQIMR